MRTFLCKRGNTPPTSPTLPTCIRPLVTTNHSTVVANKHYWQVTDEDFERAIQGSSKATQNTTQHPAAPTGTAPQNPSTSREKQPFMRKTATTCVVVQLSEVPPRGVELSDDSPRNTPGDSQGGTVCGTPDADCRLTDADLRSIIESWPDLPDTVKDAVMRMVRG